MAKFISHDGVDKNGVRAEVSVQVGTGRVKEINGRGKEADDGSFRNVEVVFDPDNPLLKRKVYALLDTTAKDLFDYAQAALNDQRTVAFRIESQRKRGVDRTVKFEDLKHTEEAVRVLAGLDNVFSHEAKTDPAEDPSNDNPSALEQHKQGLPVSSPGGPVAAVNLDTVLEQLGAARNAGLSATIIDTLVGHALAAGATIEQTGVKGSSTYPVGVASRAEQFALDHLVEHYSEGVKGGVDVSEEMVSQAASVALELLFLADSVHARVVGGEISRFGVSYESALHVVLDAVAKRHPVPLGEKEGAQNDWRAAVTEEATERLHGIVSIAQGVNPAILDSETENVVPVEETTVNETVNETVNVSEFSQEVSTNVDTTVLTLPAPVLPDSPDFIEPDENVIGRLRELCILADVMADPRAIGAWLESKTGNRVSRRVHAPILEQFVEFYETAGPERVRADVKIAETVTV